MQFNRKRLNARFYIDHLLSKNKHLEENMGAWIYTTGKFTVDYPCIKRSEVGYNLQRFADDVGILD